MRCCNPPKKLATALFAIWALLGAAVIAPTLTHAAPRKAVHRAVPVKPAARPAPPVIIVPAAPAKPSNAAIEAAYKAFDERHLEEAFPVLVLACDNGTAKACSKVAAVYRSPGLDMFDAFKAIDLYRKSCTLGYGPGCYASGDYSWEFARTEEAKATSTLDLKRGCDIDDANSCNTYGYRLERGMGVAKDAKGGLPFYLKSCDLKQEIACVNAGIDLENGFGADKDPVRARSLYDKACGLKSLDGCFWSALMLQNGNGIAADPTAAKVVFADLCTKELPRSCAQMGYMAQYGVGGARDQSAAREFYRSACVAKFVRGCTNLAWMLYRGEGGAVDYGRAVDLFGLACDQGQAYACTGMADAYTKAHGVMIDLSAAAMYRARAAQLTKGD